MYKHFLIAPTFGSLQVGDLTSLILMNVWLCVAALAHASCIAACRFGLCLMHACTIVLPVPQLLMAMGFIYARPWIPGMLVYCYSHA